MLLEIVCRASWVSGGLDTVPPMHERITVGIPSTSKENLYGWLKDIPGMREWLGERVVNTMSIDGYRIRNRNFESTVGVKRDDIEDDNYGVYEAIFRHMGENTGRHANELVFDLLKNGFNSPCYDGQYFFDVDHPVLDEKGHEQSVSNFMGGSGTPWYLACTTRVIKPLIFQKRREPTLVRLDAENGHHVFMRGEYLYGVDARYNAGYGLWQLIIASRQPLTVENFEAARAALLGMTKDYGGKLALTADLLLVPAPLEGAARRILNAEFIGINSTTESNVWKDSAEVLVCPWLKEQ